MCCMYTVYSGMQECVIQIPSIPILVSVLFPSLHLKYFRIKFLLLVKATFKIIHAMRCCFWGYLFYCVHVLLPVRIKGKIIIILYSR